MHEYDLIAEWYASERRDQTGVPEVTALAQSLPSGAMVLDVGCGNGNPITRALLSAGHRVVGLDSSREMLARFRVNCPDTPAVRGLVQSSPFTDGVFDAAVGWGVMFHLNPDDEMKAIASVSRVLKAGAPFLFTAGDADAIDGKDVDGFKEDTMNGVVFRYFSFSRDGYRRILGEHAFTLVDVHEDSGKNTYYLACKSSALS
jgi:SAM-dependent methyltransferase